MTDENGGRLMGSAVSGGLASDGSYGAAVDHELGAMDGSGAR